jgi:hypothetical protein
MIQTIEIGFVKNMKNGGGDCHYYTPSKYVEMAREVMGSIDLDPASDAIANETVKAAHFYDIRKNGLRPDWNGNIFCNPSYRRGIITAFVNKFLGEGLKGRMRQGIILTMVNHNAKWCHKLMSHCPIVAFTQGPICFNTPSGKPQKLIQGSMFSYWGDNVEKFKEVFGAVGTCSLKS